MKSIDFYERRFYGTRIDLRKYGLLYKIAWYIAIDFLKLRLIDRCIESGMLLDLGCGGGNELLALKGRCIGVDISVKSLEFAKNIYDHVVRADVRKLPFKSKVFDYVVSVDVLGHIPYHEKNGCLLEIVRVLKDHGKTIHYVEADGQDPLTRIAKKDELLYRKYFIEQDGHIGLEKVSDIKKRFQKFFCNVRVTPMFGIVAPPSEYAKRFFNQYGRQYSTLRLLGYIGKAFTSNLYIRGLIGSLLSILHAILMKLCPLDWGGGALVEAYL
ncbi:MAG: class I SAM-dependent methyltransferase [Candidatus Freyarchaeota archaeon]|nr:class I SAM-dependent methyltransferase [Candidatus Jordarchaeia archaeon]